MKKIVILTLVCMMLSLASFAQTNKRPDSYNYNRAVEAIQNNNVEEALDYLKKEISDAPKNGYAYSWLAYVREYQGEYGLALSAADKAVKNILAAAKLPEDSTQVPNTSNKYGITRGADYYKR